MSDAVNLGDPTIQNCLRQLSADFQGRVALIYEAGNLLRTEVSDSLRSNTCQRGGGPLEQSLIDGRLKRLPPNLYGRVTFVYESGAIVDLEIVQSLKPIVDRARSPIAKSATEDFLQDRQKREAALREERDKIAQRARPDDTRGAVKSFNDATTGSVGHNWNVRGPR